MSFNTVAEIINSGLFLKLTKKERDFLVKNLSDDSANMPPDSYNVYGKQIGSGNSRPFRFYKPIIERTPSGNKIVGFSWKPFSGGELAGTRGTTDQKNRSPINEETTNDAIDLAEKGDISKREAISIIRARVGLEQADFPYQIPKEPFTDNDIQRPIVFGIKYGDGTYPGTNFSGQPGSTDLKDHLTSIKRSEGHIEKITSFYNKLQEKISSGEWKMTFCVDGKMIIYELIDNPYFQDHNFGTSRTDANLNSTSDLGEDKNNLPRWVPAKIKRPVSFVFQEFYNLSENEKALDSLYMNSLMSGKNINGEKLPSSSFEIFSEDFKNLFITKREHKIRNNPLQPVGDLAYGSKNYVYGAFFSAMAGRVFLMSYGTKLPFVSNIVARNPDLYTGEGFRKSLEILEGYLTNFKLFKDITTADFFRFTRDVVLSKIAHTYEQAISGRIIIGPGAGIPWFGWALAGAAILFDIIQPIVAQKIDEQSAKDRYVEALQSQNHDNPNSVFYRGSGRVLNWKSLQNGQGIDPGIAIFNPDCIVPIDIDERGENTDPPIGIERDKDGNPLIDPKTKRPKLIYPKRRKYSSPSSIFQNHHIPIDEIGMQDNIESNTIQEHLGNLADAHANSDLENIPQSSIQIPYRQQPEATDLTNEYRRTDDLINPFPEESMADVNPNGLSPVLLSEFFVKEPDQTGVVYIYGEKLIYPNNAPTGNSNTIPMSNQTLDSTFIRSGG